MQDERLFEFRVVEPFGGRHKYNEFICFEDGECNRPVLFQDERTDDILFVMSHGTKEGYVVFGTTLLTLENLYNLLQSRGFFKLHPNIKHVAVICCYGYYMDKIVINGITVDTFFKSKEKIYVKAFRDISDTQTIFDVKIPDGQV